MTNSDIVERLREIAFTASNEDALRDHNTTREAADTILSLKAENDALREALDRIADVWTLQARVQPTDRKWHCQHEEWLSAAVEQARAALSGSPEG